MRRPMPLPAPPRVERPQPAVVDDAQAEAPVIPLDARGDAAADMAPAPTLDDSTESAKVGFWDVWRAARARRRTLRAEVRRFTARQRRRRIVWLTALGAFALLVAGSFGAAYSPLFAVRDIQVIGTSTLDDAAVVQALSGQLGTPLPLVDSAAVKAALVKFPLVETYSLQARPPHELVVRIVERTPVGVVKSAAGYTLVDAAGVALATTSDKPKGQPVLTIDGGTASEAFRSAGQVVRSLPSSVRKMVTAVSASTADDVTLTLGDTDTKIVWGSADDSARKGLVLQKMMKSKPPSKVHSYDVSSPDAVLVR